MAEIGEKHYRAVEASLSRAAQGLVERGLIERSRVYGGAQLDLTEQGEELARTLVEDQTRV
jgi:DNA-binding MarR family transcriptional regulator